MRIKRSTKKGSRCGRMKPCKQCGTEFYCPPCRDIGSASQHEQIYCTKRCSEIANKFTPQQAIEAFWRRVEKTDSCWLFHGARDKWGYGDLRFENKHIQAHRLAWKLLRGDPGKMDCLHTCHNPPCCNPDHLYLGTDVENARDRVTSGRSLRGERAWSAKLTDDKVRDIRRTFKRTSQKKSNIPQLARDYEVSQATISAIMRGSIWKHVK